MAATDSIFPLELIVAGTPVSLGASSASRARWKAVVAQLALNRIAEITDFLWLDERPLSASIYYFCSATMEGDIDNIVKPILDAMVGITYSNDRVFERVLAQKFEPDVGWSFRQPSAILTKALEAEAPVVYIRLDDDLAWRQS